MYLELVRILINYYNHGEYNHMQNLGTSKSEYCAPTVCDFGTAECSRTWCYIYIYIYYNDNDDNNNNNNSMNIYA